MMSDNDIRKKFQSKLNGFESPPPSDGWESVERSLKAAAVLRRTIRRRWYAGSAAALLILLVGSILFFQNPVEPAGTILPEIASTSPYTGSTIDSEIGIVSESESESVESVDAGRLLVAKSPGNIRSGIQPVIHLSSPEGILTAWMEREKLQGKDVVKSLDSNMFQLAVKLGERGVTQKDKKFFEEEIITVSGDEKILLADAAVAKRGEETLLLAINGRGGLTGYQQTVNTPMTLRSAGAAPEVNKYATEGSKAPLQATNSSGNISEMEHDQPISFGITLSKYLFDNLSVETGVVYSYLHSKTRNTNNNFRVEEVQKLHYIGIPLNMNYNLFTLRKLNIYASVGGMVEKDLYGEFRRMKEAQEGQTITLNGGEEESTEMVVEKISQRNSQISVNAGVGLSYPLYDRLRLYGKIGGAYYFDAGNEHKTIYSDRKIVMDLNVGLRYEF
ncbi:MAG: porin family protein [Bacteroidales bacterium]|nr:porin family protein [Bacteroidales bacterium]